MKQKEKISKELPLHTKNKKYGEYVKYRKTNNITFEKYLEL